MNPELRFKDQDGNEFPDWEEKKLKNICIFVNGKGHEQVISQYGKYIVVNSKFVSTDGEIVKYSNEQLEPLFKDDIVMVMSDVPNGRAIAKFFYIDEDNKYSLNQRICAIRTNQNQMFIMKQLNRHKYFLAFDDGAKQTNLKKEDVLKCPVFIPDIEEQSKIATLLSDIDKKIESQVTLVEKLKNTKDAMFVKMFPQGESKVPEIRFDGFSGDWEEKKLGSVAEFIKDGTHASYKDSKVGYPLLSAKDIYNNEIHIPADCRIISEEDYKSIFKSYSLENNDILLTIVGTIGRIAIYKIAMPQVAFQRSVAIIRPKKIYDAKFISQYMSIYYFQSELLKRQNKGAQGGIYLGSLSKILVKIPSKKEEQEKIGQFFSNLDKEIEINQQKYEKLCDVKKALLSKLFPTKEDE